MFRAVTCRHPDIENPAEKDCSTSLTGQKLTLRIHKRKRHAPGGVEHAVILARYWQRWSRWAKGGLDEESQLSIKQQLDVLYVLYIQDRVSLT